VRFKSLPKGVRSEEGGVLDQGMKPIPLPKMISCIEWADQVGRVLWVNWDGRGRSADPGSVGVGGAGEGQGRGRRLLSGARVMESVWKVG